MKSAYSVIWMTAMLAILLCDGRLRANLINNGSFELGDSGFTSSYIYVTPGFNTIDGVPLYGVGANPQHYTNAGGVSYGDHTSGGGNMLIANGATDSRVVWSETSIPVVPGTQYVFSYFLSSWGYMSDGITTYVPAVVECRISGDIVGTNTAPGTVASWSKVTHIWNSQTSTTATVELWDLTMDYVGNDFAIDDISMTVVPIPGAFILGATGLSYAGWRLRRKTT